MKKLAMLLAVLVIMSLATTAFAAAIVNSEYTDVPTAMTQDSVVSIEANELCKVEVLQPDDESIALLKDVYRFVWEEENRPARYYDEETQKKISTLCRGMNIDILHITEAMRLQLTGDPEKTVTVDMELDIKYRPGQLVVAVLGDPQGNLEYNWYPYRATVPETGIIRWEIPAEEWEVLNQQPISFHVLTVRMGPGGEYLWGENSHPDSRKVFSKTSSDIYRTYRWYTESGTPIADDFRLFLVGLTDPMQQEILRIGEHVKEELPILDYFPEERKAEALLMLPEDVMEADLVAYDIVALMDEEYKDTYGDINVELRFGTTYDTEKAVIVLAGFEDKDAEEQPYMEWYVLQAEAIETIKDETETDLVMVGLKQLNLPRMAEEPLMLMVISERLEPLEESYK